MKQVISYRDPFTPRFSSVLPSFDEMEKPHQAAIPPVFYSKVINGGLDLQYGFDCKTSEQVLFANQAIRDRIWITNRSGVK